MQSFILHYSQTFYGLFLNIYVEKYQDKMLPISSLERGSVGFFCYVGNANIRLAFITAHIQA